MRRVLKDYYLAHEKSINRRVSQREQEHLTPTKSSARVMNRIRSAYLYPDTLECPALHQHVYQEPLRIRSERRGHFTVSKTSSSRQIRDSEAHSSTFALNYLPPSRALTSRNHHQSLVDREGFSAPITCDLNHDLAVRRVNASQVLEDEFNMLPPVNSLFSLL